MTDIPPGLEGLPIVVELEGGTEAEAAALRKLFDGEDEDVVFSHAFGGIDTVSIITAIGKATIGKLIDYFAKSKTDASKTKFKIGKATLQVDGFSPQDLETFLASDGFQKAVQAVRA